MKRLALLVLAGLAVGAPTAAWAQDFPTRQITLIAPWPAGGAVDAVCRALAQPLSERLGKEVTMQVTVDKRILGGLKLQYGDRLIDASVATKLQQLRRRLADAT